MNSLPLLSRGFRPFFLVAGATAALVMAAWIAALTGLGQSSTAWHAHELVFGFMGAVLGGFFLTSTPNWTKREPVTGLRLAAVVALWGIGRAAVTFGGTLPWQLVALADLLFPATLVLIVGVQIYGARSKRNYLFPVLLATWGALGALDLAHHAGVTVVSSPIRLAVYVLVALISIFGGRITRLFTRNALRDREVIVREVDRRDDVAIGSLLLLVPLQALPTPSVVLGSCMMLAGAANLIRMHGWRTRATLHNPLLWSLHLSYAWLGIGLILEGVAALAPGVLSPNLSLHAITIGCLGGFALAMMTRVTRGHTGRSLRAPATIAAAYLAITCAVLVRVAVPALAPDHSLSAWVVAAGLWTAAFATFLVVDANKLVRPRVES